MKNIRGDTLIINGQTADASRYVPDTSADLYYEVIRVVDGKYLFLHDHLERLHRSCSNRISKVPDNQEITAQLNQLINISGISEGNVKILLYEQSGTVNISCFFTDHFYPSEEDYLQGVKVRTYGFERPDPSIKRWNEAFRKQVNQYIKDHNIYEALLVNEQGLLTEGSRSNLFFIDSQNRLITAPTAQVLPGITRKIVFQICDDLGIPILEQAIRLSDISLMSACFISGTSPKVLPVQQIDEVTFDVKHLLMQRIMEAFDQLINQSLRRY